MRIKITIFILWIAILAVPVSATYFSPIGYPDSQRVMLVSENLYVSGDSIIVQFRGIIGINHDLFKYTNESAFEFLPLQGTSYGSIYNYSYYIGLQTSNWQGGDAFSSDKQAEYTSQQDNNIYTYTVNISDLNPYGTILFEANYTLNGAIRRVDDITYYLFYISQFDASTHNLYIALPKNFEIIKAPDNAKSNGYNQYYIEDYANELIYIVFKDKDAEKRLHFLEQLEWTGIGFMGSLLVSLSILLISQNKKLDGKITVKKYKNHDIIKIKILKKKTKNKSSKK